MQQRPQDYVIQQGIDSYEQMVNVVAFIVKAYWAMWGPWGEPMIEGVDRWAKRQREYLQSVRGPSVPQPASPDKLPMPLTSSLKGAAP